MRISVCIFRRRTVWRSWANCAPWTSCRSSCFTAMEMKSVQSTGYPRSLTVRPGSFLRTVPVRLTRNPLTNILQQAVSASPSSYRDDSPRMVMKLQIWSSRTLERRWQVRSGLNWPDRLREDPIYDVTVMR